MIATLKNRQRYVRFLKACRLSHPTNPEAIAYLEGDTKYGAFNWRRKAVRRRVYLTVILRRTLAAFAGEDYDPDTLKATGHKIPHEAKIRACCGIIIDSQECGNLIDDRFEKDSTARPLSLFTAGDYHKAATKLVRTPARMLADVRAGLAGDRRKPRRR